MQVIIANDHRVAAAYKHSRPFDLGDAYIITTNDTAQLRGIDPQGLDIYLVNVPFNFESLYHTIKSYESRGATVHNVSY